jgi:hypothetical protein
LLGEQGDQAAAADPRHVIEGRRARRRADQPERGVETSESAASAGVCVMVALP